jgi:hypothetical protein
MISMPGVTYSTFIFSAESSFIEKLVITPFPVYSILKAKYELYCLFAMIMTIIFFPSVFLGVRLNELLSSFFCSIGFMYFMNFQSACYNRKSFDIKARKYYNWQGYSTISQYIIPIVSFIGSMGGIALIYLFLGENITLIFMSVIGIGFILTNKFWLKAISRNFENNKQYRLECFREK